MQVLKDVKVKFVWAVDVRLWLSSTSVSGFLRDPGLIVLLLIKKKSLSLTTHLLSGFCRSSSILQAKGEWAPFFPFPVVPQGLGLSLGYNIHRCPVSSPHPQSAVGPTLSTLCICTSSANNPPHFTTLWLSWVGWNCIAPPPSLLAWVLHAIKIPSGQFISLIEISLSGCCYLSEPLLLPFD